MTLALGDTVTAPYYFCTGTVIGFYGAWVWVLLPDASMPLTFNRNSLKIVRLADKAA